MNRIEPNRPRTAPAPPGAAGPTPAVSAAPAPKQEAAAGPKDQYVAGKPGQAKEPPADPLSDLSEIRQRRSARTDAVKKVCPEELSRDQMLQKAREAIVSSFEKDFVPTPEFQDTFEGQQWPELKDRIQADAKSFGTDPNYQDAPEADGGVTFVGQIYGLYTEVTVHPDGKVDRPYFEID
jgi:hypothetical protein